MFEIANLVGRLVIITVLNETSRTVHESYNCATRLGSLLNGIRRPQEHVVGFLVTYDRCSSYTYNIRFLMSITTLDKIQHGYNHDLGEKAYVAPVASYSSNGMLFTSDRV